MRSEWAPAKQGKGRVMVWRRGVMGVLLACAAAGCAPASHPVAGRASAPTAEEPLPSPEPYVRVIHGQEGVRKLTEEAASAAEAAEPDTLDKTRLAEVQFTEMPLETAAQMLTRMIGRNVVVSAKAKDLKVNVYLQNVTARAVIEGLCRINGLWYREDGGMIRLLTQEEYGHELVIRHDDQTRLYYLKNASALGVAEMIAAMMPDEVEYIRPGDDSSFGHVGTDGDDPLENNAVNEGTNGTTGTSPSGRSTPWGDGVARSSYRNTTTDVDQSYARGVTASRVEQLAQGVAERRTGEVTTKAIAEKTGAKPPVAISVFLRNNCIGVRTVQDSVHEEIGKIIKALDTPTRQVLLEVKILKLALGNDFESLFSLSYNNTASTSSVGGQWLSTAVIGGNTVSFTYLDQHITAAMKLLKSDDRLHVTATPLLLCANNAPGEFFSGITRMITTNYDYETRYGDNNQAVDIARPLVEEREIGTLVRIKPSINTDGTVTLRFYLEVSSVNPNGADVYQVKGDQLVALPIDTINNEKVESIVVAHHGQAVLMGGLISDTISKTKERVPGVGDVPVLGFFFGKRTDNKSREETVVMIIPHIIGVPPQGGAVSDKVLQENSAHPWVKDGQKNLTEWDAQREELNEILPPAPPASPAPESAPAAEPPNEKP